MTSTYAVFEYLYRDASNYKAWGKLLLRGSANGENERAVREALDSGEFFIAENAEIPTLYSELYIYSGGPNEDDHCFHEFAALREATEDEQRGLPIWGSLSDLLNRLRA